MNSMTWSTVWKQLDDCQRFAKCLAQAIDSPIVIELNGTLGAGKTQLVKFLVESLGGKASDVTSPTFVLVHRYATRPVVYHLDAYRVGDDDEFLELGIEEMFEEPATMVVEWGERFAHLLPADRIVIRLEWLSDAERQVESMATGEASARILGKLMELMA